MLKQEQLTRDKITLKGSAKIITEFFDYGLNSILFQRGIYPAEDFKIVQKYGLNILVTTDTELQLYIKNVLQQVENWILAKTIKKLVMTINSKDTRETLERWQFDIHLEDEEESSQSNSSKPPKTEKQISMEIQSVIKQITASVTFLPIIEERCTFNILVYAGQDVKVPTAWVDSDPHHVKNSEQVRLRSFSTDVHRVEAMVAYRRDPELC
ncbi:hypothetical protein BB559_004198 [Furculomyces boomerangus]|uniref:HORMA domain-containing protein n=2 Tax=Harpellales TaxID=61421 RepID=A0A2T9YG11_9FUNG|nr:hypothetical protein BB559_004198 [Furculomyces boomerangus]PWA00005.1 hypothetical protein BB558_003967 [Smittium angustum]